MSDTLTRRNPERLAPPPQNRFAHAVVVPTGRQLIFLAGQAAANERGEIVGEDLRSQTVQTFRNVAIILEDNGATPAGIVQMTIYVVDYKPGDLTLIESAGDEVFGSGWPVTASALIGCQRLGAPQLLVEICAILAVAA